MDYFKCQFLDLLKKCISFEPEFNENEFNIKSDLKIHDIALSMNNSLKKQKPLHHLLSVHCSKNKADDI